MKNICIERELWDHVRGGNPKTGVRWVGRLREVERGRGEAGFLRWQELRER